MSRLLAARRDGYIRSRAHIVCPALLIMAVAYVAMMISLHFRYAPATFIPACAITAVAAALAVYCMVADVVGRFE